MDELEALVGQSNVQVGAKGLDQAGLAGMKGFDHRWPRPAVVEQGEISFKELDRQPARRVEIAKTLVLFNLGGEPVNLFFNLRGVLHAHT